MVLTVELQNQTDGHIGEVAICCDEQGLEKFIKQLEKLRRKKDHIHLMTPSWAGSELTEQKQGGNDYQLVNHLRIVKL